MTETIHCWGISLPATEGRLAGVFYDQEHPLCCGNRDALRRLLFPTREQARSWARTIRARGVQASAARVVVTLEAKP